jgi:hypothetical protein
MNPHAQPHRLTSRTEAEVTWFQRRDVIQAAAAWVAIGGAAGAFAQERSNIVQLTGDALVNGLRLRPETSIVTGDQIETGPNSNLMFVIGNAAFQVRQNSRLSVERGGTINAVSLLRLLTGAVVSVWGKGQNRSIVLPTLTAGIRGTGVYAEVVADQGNRNYFCNCYGTVELDNQGNKFSSEAVYHQSFYAEVEPRDGKLLTPAPALNHTDEELEFLARLVDQRTAWQISGVKGQKDRDGKITSPPYFSGG